MQAFAAQIEEAVFEPRLFGILLLAKDRQRQFIGMAQNLHVAHKHLDLTGRNFVVDQFRVTRFHIPINPDHPFRAHFLDL